MGRKYMLEPKNKLEELKLVELAKQGNQEAMSALLENYDALLTLIVINQMANICAKGIEYFELKNIARIAVFSFLKYYDEDRSSFRTFISLIVNQEVKKYIVDFIKRQNELKQCLFLDEQPFEESDITNDDLVPSDEKSPSQWYELNEQYDEFKEIDEEYLSKKEKAALLLKAAGYKYSEISKIINTKESAVDIALKKFKKDKIKKVK